MSFTAQRPARLRGKRYQTGDVIVVRLARAWHDEEGIAEGGPWGWGGYTSRFIATLEPGEEGQHETHDRPE